MLDLLVFWTFQVINVPTAVGMFLFPRHFHQAMLKKPAAVYSALGFSPTAVAMLHNVLRGQGAALLAISGGVGYLRAAHPGVVYLSPADKYHRLTRRLLHRIKGSIREGSHGLPAAF